MKHFIWIPSVYVLEGLFYALVTTTSVVMYKNYQISNSLIAFYTSLLSIPWFLKPLAAPFLEKIVTPRNLLLITSLFAIFWTTLLIFSFPFQHFFSITLIIFFGLAITSSIFDMSADTLYISNLNRLSQAQFIGIRTISYHCGRLIAQGAIVFVAGYLLNFISLQQGWQIALLMLLIFLLILLCLHFYILPSENIQKTPISLQNHFTEIMNCFRQIPFLYQVIFFTIFYNFSENQIMKILPLFLIDSINHGGLNFSITEASFLIGAVSVIAMLFGILVSGWLLSRMTIQKIFIPVTVLTFITNSIYLLLSIFNIQSIEIVAAIIFIAQFSFGLSNGVYLYYLLHVFGHHKYTMSIYAIGTAFMGLGAMLAGATSGFIQMELGYNGFFIWVSFSSLLILIYTYFLTKRNIIKN